MWEHLNISTVTLYVLPGHCTVSKYVLPVMCTVSNRHKKMFVTFLFSVTRHRPLGRKPMTFLLLVQWLRALPLSYSRLVGAKATNHRYIPLGWSRSESVICDHSDHGRSNEPVNPLWTGIWQVIWSTMIWVITDHWSLSGSSQKKAPYT